MDRRRFATNSYRILAGAYSAMFLLTLAASFLIDGGARLIPISFKAAGPLFVFMGLHLIYFCREHSETSREEIEKRSWLRYLGYRMQSAASIVLHGAVLTVCGVAFTYVSFRYIPWTL